MRGGAPVLRKRYLLYSDPGAPPLSRFVPCPRSAPVCRRRQAVGRVMDIGMATFLVTSRCKPREWRWGAREVPPRRLGSEKFTAAGTPISRSLHAGIVMSPSAVRRDRSARPSSIRAVRPTMEGTMRATSPSPVAAAFVVLALVGGCADSTGPSLGDTSPGQLAVIPGAAIISPGEAVQLQATMSDRLGRRQQSVTVTWRSSEAVATVSASGQVLGVAEGRAVITAMAPWLSCPRSRFGPAQSTPVR